MPETYRKSDVEFCGTLANETPKCWFVNDGKEDIAIPKSQVLKMRQLGNSYHFVLTIPHWLAEKKGIIEKGPVWQD
jgi:hypothetical protein